jgi:hypothetical protein
MMKRMRRNWKIGVMCRRGIGEDVKELLNGLTDSILSTETMKQFQRISDL